MKKLLGALVVLLAYVQIAGFTPLYFCVLQEIKTEMNLELSAKEDLSRIVIDAAEYNNPSVFSLADGEHEFTYYGKMYDFKTVEKQGDKYVFYALMDDKENALTALLGSIFDQQGSNGKNTKSPFAKLLKNMEKDFTVAPYHCVSRVAEAETFSEFVVFFRPSRGYYKVIASPPDFSTLT